MKKLKKGEKGFTLIELLIVIAITGLITAGLTTTIMQVLTMSHRTANRMTAVRQVQQAGFWVSPDVLMTQQEPVIGENPATNFLTLNWTEWGTNNTHTVIYTLQNMPPGELKKLQRSHSVNDELPTVTPIAEYIDPDQTSCCCDCDGDGDCDVDCNCDDLVLIFKVTATVGGQSETRVYEVKPRPGS